MDDKHTIILIVGKTASGKSSLVKKICERSEATYLKSYTTRHCRGEGDDDHIFVDEDYYNRQKELGSIVAETEIAGCHYFSTMEQIYESDFYVIDAEGIKVLKSMNLNNIRFITVYIKVADAERELRALRRGDDKKTFRIRNFSESSQFREFIRDEVWDYAIDNTDFAKAYSVLRWIATVEGVLN